MQVSHSSQSGISISLWHSITLPILNNRIYCYSQYQGVHNSCPFLHIPNQVSKNGQGLLDILYICISIEFKSRTEKIDIYKYSNAYLHIQSDPWEHHINIADALHGK